MGERCNVRGFRAAENFDEIWLDAPCSVHGDARCWRFEKHNAEACDSCGAQPVGYLLKTPVREAAPELADALEAMTVAYRRLAERHHSRTDDAGDAAESAALRVLAKVGREVE